MSANRTLIIALVASGALNLFLVGGIAGAAWMRQEARREAPIAAAQAQRPPLWTAGRDLPPEHRRALRRSLREAALENRADAQAARAERRAVVEAMAEGRFDRAEAERRMAAARALESGVRAKVDGRLVAFAESLPPEERKVLAEGLRRVYAPRQKPRDDRPERPRRKNDGQP
ncbi:periplasmic heavy metal sensor [Caulobacter endophyticus]|uniref:periplasmic heavy metal sensor n=1 Tax=Caulobacter endophyticus TaxID=2172652 RepID=UPI00241059C4|nr:periplasmic heavy metal sensor [Caulobacter endophyticus]MDG2527575.1 periplasmic heavy metal sensor [Caulobacter endophyticus]